MASVTLVGLDPLMLVLLGCALTGTGTRAAPICANTVSASRSRVFEDPNQLSIQDRFEGDEERWQTMGLVNAIVVLIVAHTVSDDGEEEIVRIISARKATPRERQRYHEGI